MKWKKILLFIFAALAMVVIIYALLQGSESLDEYSARIDREREEKNNFMRNSSDSPIKPGTEKFKPLKYFKADPLYRVDAALTPLEGNTTRTLTTSDGLSKNYREYGYASFQLNGRENKLLILEITDPGPYRGTLFLAFTDETSGKETYGAGRYLELKKNHGMSSISLDFNNAYNPYCAYADNFSCPFPPKENNLKIAIYAGEKTYH